MKIFAKKFIIISLIFIIISSPIINSSIISSKIVSTKVKHISNDKILDTNEITLAIIHTKQNGYINITTKEITRSNYENLIYEITENISKTKPDDKPFSNILQIIKEKKLLNNNISLDEIIGNKTSELLDTTTYNLSIMEPFVSMFVPIVAVGMGFGAGIGDKFGSVTGLLYSGGIIGLGAVLCFDALMKTIYVQYTFTFPLLLHIITSFIGIMMFPVDFDFISENYLPLFIYSNFIAIGYSALAIGIPLGYY